MNFLAGMVMADNHYYGFSANIDTVPMQHMYASLGFSAPLITSRKPTVTKPRWIRLRLTMGLGLSLGGSYGTPKYREMQELYSDDDDYSTTKYDTNVGVSWSNPTLGRFSELLQQPDRTANTTAAASFRHGRGRSAILTSA